MKIAINVCFGGFSLSPLATKRLAELNGRECFFFKNETDLRTHTQISMEEAEKAFMWSAFSVSNPDEVMHNHKPWNEQTMDERQASNVRYREICLDSRPEDRSDVKLIKVIEELGSSANGSCAKLRIVEIPDGVDYEIDEYDGNEHIAEKHRTWGRD